MGRAQKRGLRGLFVLISVLALLSAKTGFAAYLEYEQNGTPDVLKGTGAPSVPADINAALLSDDTTYHNITAAAQTAATTRYPDSYSVLNGTWQSGDAASMQTVDADRLTILSNRTYTNITQVLSDSGFETIASITTGSTPWFESVYPSSQRRNVTYNRFDSFEGQATGNLGTSASNTTPWIRTNEWGTPNTNVANITTASPPAHTGSDGMWIKLRSTTASVNRSTEGIQAKANFLDDPGNVAGTGQAFVHSWYRWVTTTAGTPNSVFDALVIKVEILSGATTYHLYYWTKIAGTASGPPSGAQNATYRWYNMSATVASTWYEMSRDLYADVHSASVFNLTSLTNFTIEKIAGMGFQQASSSASTSNYRYDNCQFDDLQVLRQDEIYSNTLDTSDVGGGTKSLKMQLASDDGMANETHTAGTGNTLYLILQESSSFGSVTEANVPTISWKYKYDNNLQNSANANRVGQAIKVNFTSSGTDYFLVYYYNITGTVPADAAPLVANEKYVNMGLAATSWTAVADRNLTADIQDKGYATFTVNGVGDYLVMNVTNTSYYACFAPNFTAHFDNIWLNKTVYTYTAETEFQLSGVPNSPASITVNHTGQYDYASIPQTIWVWNYSSSAYEQKDSFTSGSANTDETRNFTITTSPSNYVSSGAMKVKVKGELANTLNWLTYRGNQLYVSNPASNYQTNVEHTSTATALPSGHTLKEVQSRNKFASSDTVTIYALQIWNVTGSAWTNCYTPAAQTTETARTCSITATPANYIDGSNKIKMKLYSDSTPAASFATRENQIFYRLWFPNVTSADLIPNGGTTQVNITKTFQANCTATCDTDYDCNGVYLSVQWRPSGGNWSILDLDSVDNLQCGTALCTQSVGTIPASQTSSVYSFNVKGGISSSGNEIRCYANSTDAGIRNGTTTQSVSVIGEYIDVSITGVPITWGSINPGSNALATSGYVNLTINSGTNVATNISVKGNSDYFNRTTSPYTTNYFLIGNLSYVNGTSSTPGTGWVSTTTSYPLSPFLDWASIQVAGLPASRFIYFNVSIPAAQYPADYNTTVSIKVIAA